jgi:hypothetical protein
MSEQIIQAPLILVIHESIQDSGNKGPFEILEKYKRPFFMSFYEVFNKMTKDKIHETHRISIVIYGDSHQLIFPKIHFDFNIKDRSIIQTILIPYFIKQSEYEFSYRLKELDIKLEKLQNDI